MDLKSLFMNPIVIAILVFYFIGMLIPKTEKFTNSPQIVAASALVQGGATLQQAMALGVKKSDYMTATYLVAHKE
jgi:NAD/NADP transhydrogenase beta subunit